VEITQQGMYFYCITYSVGSSIIKKCYNLERYDDLKNKVTQILKFISYFFLLIFTVFASNKVDNT